MERVFDRALSAKSFAMVLLSVLGILIILFAPSFDPKLVLFANDAPLGNLMAEQGKGLSNFYGVWTDSNWIGSVQPSAIPNFSNLWFVLTQAVGYAKTYVPISLLILGLSAWLFFAQLRFHPVACLLVAIAAALNMNTFSNACWGLPSRALTLASAFLALAAMANFTRNRVWVRMALAGLAIGLGVTEGYDVGAIFSVFLAAFGFYLCLTSPGSEPRRALIFAVARVACMAFFAVFIAAQALTTLISTQVQGVAELQSQTKEERWNWATQWSLPKIETLRVLIPGLYGYRMTDADESLYEGSYWGQVGRDALWPQRGLARHSGSGEYAGVLVLLLAAWSLVEARRRTNGVFSPNERKVVWFWAVAAAVSLVLAFGRYTPFYRIIYALPYFSTIRNPIKFMHPFHLSILVLFGYGVEAICRRYLAGAVAPSLQLTAQVQRWWKAAKPFERRWMAALGALLFVSVVIWLGYAGASNRIETILKSSGFPPELAPQIARFSIGETGWYILFLIVSIAALAAVMSGWFAGPRSKWAAALLGVILFADLARADRFWIVYLDYTQTNATNPVIDFFRNKPWEHRVAGRLYPTAGAYAAQEQMQQIFGGTYNHWLRDQFQFYRIQSLDIVQMPRSQERDDLFLKKFMPSQGWTSSARLWQLTSTRYILGQRPFVDFFNAQFDPEKKRFAPALNFDFASSKPAGVKVRMEDIVAVAATNGNFSVFEFSGALPRAKLFSRWQVMTNDQQALDQLALPSFDPEESVIISSATPALNNSTNSAPAGAAVIQAYAPKRIVVRAEPRAPSILLMTDKFDPNWTVTVDDRPGELLRCNYLMRGVLLQPGEHQVVFEFRPPSTALFVSLAAIVIGLGLLCVLVFIPANEI